VHIRCIRISRQRIRKRARTHTQTHPGFALFRVASVGVVHAIISPAESMSSKSIPLPRSGSLRRRSGSPNEEKFFSPTQKELTLSLLSSLE
jgi:hypothetical protein